MGYAVQSKGGGAVGNMALKQWIAVVALGLMLSPFQNCSRVEISGTEAARKSHAGPPSDRGLSNNGAGYNGKLSYYSVEANCADGLGRSSIEVDVGGKLFPQSARRIRENCVAVSNEALDLGRQVIVAANLRSLSFDGRRFELDQSGTRTVSESELVLTCRASVNRSGPVSLFMAVDNSGLFFSSLENTSGGFKEARPRLSILRGTTWTFENDPADPGHYAYLDTSPSATGFFYNLRLNFSEPAQAAEEIQLDGRAECFAP